MEAILEKHVLDGGGILTLLFSSICPYWGSWTSIELGPTPRIYQYEESSCLNWLLFMICSLSFPRFVVSPPCRPSVREMVSAIHYKGLQASTSACGEPKLSHDYQSNILVTVYPYYSGVSKRDQKLNGLYGRTIICVAS